MDTKESPPVAVAGPYVRPHAYYRIWQGGEGIPAHAAFHVDDLARVELGEWTRYGCRGAFVNLTDSHITTAAILEIAPGRATKPLKHLFEQIVFGVRGTGRTTVTAANGKSATVEWGPRSLFAPPLNATYVHENAGSEPLRLLMVSNAPLVMSLYHNDRFVFDTRASFDDRFDGSPDFFARPGRHIGGRVFRVNFVPDLLAFELIKWKLRGTGARSFHLSMSDNTMACHVSEFGVGTYKKAHRHGPGAHVVILQGEGYSLLWPEGTAPVRVYWRAGSMFAPPEWWYHQHFNTGTEPARYVALRRGGSPEHPLRIGMTGGSEDTGGDQIEYEREDPAILEDYRAELARKGIALRMADGRDDA